VGDPVVGDGLRSGDGVVGDPTGVGEPLVGVAVGLGVCDGLGDRVGLGEVVAGVDVGAVGEGLAYCWVSPAGAAVLTGRTR
jgi:hypothetical protein